MLVLVFSEAPSDALKAARAFMQKRGATIGMRNPRYLRPNDPPERCDGVLYDPLGSHAENVLRIYDAKVHTLPLDHVALLFELHNSRAQPLGGVEGEHPEVDSILTPDSLADVPRVIIVGGGPSLREFDWNLLRGEVVIGANRAFERPHVGTLLTIDRRFFRWLLQGEISRDPEDAKRALESWRAFDGLAIYATTQAQARLGIDDKMVYLKRVQDKKPSRPTLQCIGEANNSGLAALLLAWAAGAKEIMLIGFDMGGENGRQAWHHGDYPHVRDDKAYAPMLEQFRHVAPMLLSDGVSVSVWGNSALDCFPRGSLDSLAAVLRTNKPVWPTVVCCHTPGEYASEAKQMARTARIFGMEVALEEFEPTGCWIRNAGQKVHFMRRKLEELNRPILWLDADARVRRYPRLLAELATSDVDAGLSWFRWAAVPGDRRQGEELSSAVMLWRPTTGAFAALDAWSAAMRQTPQRFEQKVLQEMMGRGALDGLHYAELPMSYNQIFDSMAVLGKPIIEQMQASRRFKRSMSCA